MSPKTPDSISTRISRFFAITAIESVLAVVWVMAIPKSPKNAWLLGFSKARYGMALPVVVLALLLIGLWLRYQKNTPWAERVTHSFETAHKADRLQGLADFAVLATVAGSYLLVKWWFFLDTGFDYQTAVARITPYLLLGVMICLQIVLTIYPRPAPKTSERPAGFVEKSLREIARHRQLPGVVALFAVGLTIAHVVGWELRSHPAWLNTVMFYIEEFNMDNENVLQSYFSGAQLLTAGMVLGVIGAYQRKIKAPFSLRWILLGIVFVYLSVDEVLQIHENWELPFAHLIASRGYFFINWVRSAIILVAALGLFYLRFFLNLPTRSKLLFGLSGAVYLTGVLGMEMLAGKYVSTYHQWGYDYGMLVAREEALEMLGISLFLFALIDYIRRQLPRTSAEAG